MGKIVIVDDSRLARTFTASCLKKLDHTVLKVLKEARPDLLIMDFLMPNCPGTSLARVCKEDPDLQTMKTLVITAHHDDEITTRLMTMGESAVLYKPVDAAELAAKVTELLA